MPDNRRFQSPGDMADQSKVSHSAARPNQWGRNRMECVSGANDIQNILCEGGNLAHEVLLVTWN